MARLLLLSTLFAAISCGRSQAEARKDESAASAQPRSWRWVGVSPSDIHGLGCEPLAWLPPGAASTWEAEAHRLGANVISDYDPPTKIGRAYTCPAALLDTLMGPGADIKRAPDLAPPSSELLQRCERDRDADACLEAAERARDNGYQREGEYLEKACDAGLPVACFLLARKVTDEAPMRARGMAVYERRCKVGDRAACADAAIIYEKGLGVPADPDRAKALLDK